MSLRHVILTNPTLRGAQYGMQRDLEAEIMRLTGATPVIAPPPVLPEAWRGRVAHGTRFAAVRAAVPRRRWSVEADVFWAVLMGPEDSDLDMLRMEAPGATKVLYLFDTFPHQLPALRRLLAAVDWDVAIASFPAAVTWLAARTGRRWEAVPQGVRLERFAAMTAERPIAFASYGRRLDEAHAVIARFADRQGLRYDHSTGSPGAADPLAAYAQYSANLRQAVFSVNWPVEVTHPERSGGISSLTCRWFEAAAAGCIMIGKAPADPTFIDHFGPSAVVDLSAPLASGRIEAALDAAWRDRHRLQRDARRLLEARGETWTWQSRVQAMLALVTAARR